MQNNKPPFQLTLQRNIILVLAVLLVFALTTTVTLAVYTKFEQDSTDITLSAPVRVYITGKEQGTTVIPEDVAVYPGTKITLNLGFDMESPSTSAYVRTKLKITSDAFVEEGGTLIEEGLVVFGNSRPNPNNWVLVDFAYSDDNSTQDIWWVYSTYDQQTDSYTAKVYKDEDPPGIFISGTIKISKALTNEFANKKINILFQVSAIQQPNVKEPIISSSPYYVIKDEEGNDQRVYIGTWGEEKL